MTEHDMLPVPDYDHLPLGGLTSRIRSLDAAGIETLLRYEKAHGNRLPVVTVLENRLTSLREGAQPSSGDPAAASDDPVHSAGESKVSEATSGPPVNRRRAATRPTRPSFARALTGVAGHTGTFTDLRHGALRSCMEFTSRRTGQLRLQQ